MPKGPIPSRFLDLFDKRTFASLVTLMPDGSPQVTPVWCDYEDGRVVVNTARGRQKHKNMERDPRVALSLIDPDNPYRYLEVRGRVTDITEEGARQHIDKMAQKYLNREQYPFAKPGEVRILCHIKPQHTSFME